MGFSRFLGAGFLLAAGAALAQGREAPAHSERIEVTGSNIPRVQGEGALPLQVITRDDIERGGMATMQDIVERVSSHQSFGAWNEATGVGQEEFGNTSASLRGLGSQRTLILLNGRRLAPYALSNGARIDLSAIPVSAIERVEVLKDGASAIYGTDAIGGVINFILRRDFQGVEAGGRYLKTQQGGGDSWQASIGAGFGDPARDRYNLLVALDFARQESLRASAREATRTAYRPELGLDNTSGNSFPANIAQPGIFTRRNPSIGPGGATENSCAPPLSFPTAQNPRACAFDYASVVDAIPESDKTNLIARYTYAFSPDDRLFVEATYYRGRAIQRVSPTPVIFLNSAQTLPPSSPFYPADFVRAIGGNPAAPIRVTYRLVELGPRVREVESDQQRWIAGVQGMRWGWDYHGAVGYVGNRQVLYLVSGEVSEARFGPLLRSGVVNPFGFNTEEVLRQMRATEIHGKSSDNRASHYGMDFKVSREVLALPAGPLAVALGVEARRERLELQHEPILYTGDIVGGSGALPSFAANGRRAASLFAEASIPILATLEANLAVRTDRYNDFGTTTNPKATLRWQPAKWVVARAAYGTGFRAPTLADLWLPEYFVGFATDIDDPLRCPVTRSEDDCGREVRLLRGGNPGLQPEKSRQLNVGVVLEPSRPFSVAIDFYRVVLRDMIGAASDLALLTTHARRGAPTPDHPDLPGPLLAVADNFYNVGMLRTSGVDVDARWRASPKSWGRVGLSVAGTYVLTYRISDIPFGLPTAPGRRGPGSGAIARWRHYASLDWSRGPWGATLAQTFQSGYREPDLRSCVEGVCPVDRRVRSHSVFDLQARYIGISRVTLAFGVRNLLDRAPPASSQGASFQVGIDPTYGDARGRMWYASVRRAF